MKRGVGCCELQFLNWIFALCTIVCMISCSKTYANVENMINIYGSQRVAVGKSNTVYSADCICNGTITSFHFSISQGDYILAETSNENENLTIAKMPLEECQLTARVDVVYDGGERPGYFSRSQPIYVQLPSLYASQYGMDGRIYHMGERTPIHWNIDSDARQTEPDYKIATRIDFIDNDILPLRVQAADAGLDTENCQLKINTESSLRLWSDRKKGSRFCGVQGCYIEISNCDINQWLNNLTNFSCFVEWRGSLSYATYSSITFYCNDVEFAHLIYHGFAVTSVDQPVLSERQFYSSSGCQFTDCEWGVIDSTHLYDRNSIAETVDENATAYGEYFVATTSAPLCPDIYTLTNSIYNTRQCRCISMDTFGNRNLSFEQDIDGPAFFTSFIWDNNFLLNDNLTILSSDIIQYTGPFAAKKANSQLRTNCHSSWEMVTSRFYGRPWILHRALQLESNRHVVHKYMLCPTME